jgi:hypothetical protein
MISLKSELLTLCAVISGLVAFVSVAHAEIDARWLFAEKVGTNLVPFLEAEVELEKETGATYVLHSEMLKIKVLFICLELKVTGTPKLVANGGISTGELLYSECETYLNGKLNASCTPKDVKEGVSGTILTKPLHSLLVLHNGQDYLKVLPDDVGGSPSETVAIIEMGEFCPIGKKVPVIGVISLKDCLGLALTHVVKHLVEPTSIDGTLLTELWIISKTEEHKAGLLGSAWGLLKGVHAGIKFSGQPA